MLFILFDIEVIFLYPIAVQLRAFGTFAMTETVVFVRAADGRFRVRVAARSAGMEIKREPLARSVNTDDFRVRQLQARDMLRGDLERRGPRAYVEERVTDHDGRQGGRVGAGNSFFPLTFGLACCAIEMISIVAARVDIARFGWEAFRASPRQADLIILSGRVSIKMAPVIRRIYDQMLEPKWAISMGACCSSMGVFNNYALVPSDKFMPIDVHVPGCPPRPEALLHGILQAARPRSRATLPRAGASATTRSAPRRCSRATAAGQPPTINVFRPGDTAGA